MLALVSISNLISIDIKVIIGAKGSLLVSAAPLGGNKLSISLG